jgi:hypothetical protein
VLALEHLPFEDGLLHDTVNWHLDLPDDMIFLGHFDQAFNLVRNRVFANLESGLFNETLNVVRLANFTNVLVRHLDNVLNSVGDSLLDDLLNRNFNDPVNVVRHVHKVFDWL